MTNPEDIQKETNSQEAEKPVPLEPEKSPAELTQERLTQINHDLSSFNQRATTSEEMRQIQESRQQEYESKMS